MSTNDVPGASPVNGDKLGVGCWAEHEDGSLIFVKSTEQGRVVFEMFDTSQTPVVNYTHAMTEPEFKRRFSLPPVGVSGDEWTWHDKTAFPWDRVIKAGAKPGVHYASADDQLSAAARTAESLGAKGAETAPSDFAHLVDLVKQHPVGRAIVTGIQAALSELRK